MGGALTVSIETFFGGGSLGNPGAGIPLLVGNGRIQSLAFQSAGLAATLPDARRFNHTGGPVFILFNVGADAFDLEDNTGGVVGTIAPGCSTHVLLSDNTTRAGRWHIDCDPWVGSTSASVSASPSPSPSPSPSVSESATTFGVPSGTFTDEEPLSVTLA